MRKKPSPLIRESMEEGWRLSVQRRRQPINWAPGEREALINDAVSAGRVKHIPTGYADGLGGPEMFRLSQIGDQGNVFRRRASA